VRKKFQKFKKILSFEIFEHISTLTFYLHIKRDCDVEKCIMYYTKMKRWAEKILRSAFSKKVPQEKITFYTNIHVYKMSKTWKKL